MMEGGDDLVELVGDYLNVDVGDASLAEDFNDGGSGEVVTLAFKATIADGEDDG
jgi:hypothetical protein